MSFTRKTWLLICLSAFTTQCEVGTTTDCINSNSEDPACLRAIEQKNVPYTSASIELSSETGTSSFGDVQVNASGLLTVTVKSLGERAVVLGDISNEGLGLSGSILLTGGTCATAMTLRTNESCTLAFTFTPTEAGTVTLSPQLHFSSE